MSKGLSGKRILVVEDDYLVAATLKKQLVNAHAAVIGPVANVTAGCHLAATEAIDAAVIDVNLNGEIAWMLADQLTAAHIPHLIVTVYDGSSLPEAYRATPRLTKPYPEALMLDTVSALCGQGGNR